MDAALALLAVDPVGLGGALLRGGPGLVRDRWLAQLSEISAHASWRRVPASVAEDRLLGGIDIAATLVARRPVHTPGILREPHAGIVLASAERAPSWVVSAVIAALDDGELPCAIALDESVEDDPPIAASLADRLAFWIALPPAGAEQAAFSLPTHDEVCAAQAQLARVEAPDEAVQALCTAASSLGVRSLRAELLAVRAARAAAALRGDRSVNAEDLALAAALVLAPRAVRVPATPHEPPPPEAPPPDANDEQSDDASSSADRPLADVVLESARAAIPQHLLDGLHSSARAAQSGRRGDVRASRERGHRVGSRRGDPRRDGRLDLLETIRAAVPWQRLRGQDSGRIAIRADDFRVQRRMQRTGSTLVFLVDASGSSAMHRLAEAKGAVELLLAESYVRRDRVALGAFRGTAAELILPPTRSLARAKRALAGLPGGGGTPLASAIELGIQVAEQLLHSREESTPVLVLLTDGRANIARNGAPGREQAEADALAAARRARALNVAALVLDTGRRPTPFLAQVASAMGARYLPLPAPTAQDMRGVIRATMSS